MSTSIQSTESVSTDKPITGRRTRFHQVVWKWSADVVLKQFRTAFRMRGGDLYCLDPKGSGAFIRMDKDRRTPKERRKAAQQRRAQ